MTLSEFTETIKEKTARTMQNSPENYAAMPHILLVDDDNRIRQLVSRYLTEHGFLVTTASCAGEAYETLDAFTYDALVLDVMMPGETGLEMTARLKEQSDIPIILLTALGSADDRITGFERGADDYLPKPFEPQELVMRLRAILRRRPAYRPEQPLYRIGRWIFDMRYPELDNDAGAIALTEVEFNLLKALTQKAGHIVSREDVAALCGLSAGERTIDVQVTRLRKKIEDNPKTPRLLQTARGKGYMLQAEEVKAP